MRSKLLDRSNGSATYAIILDSGEEALSTLQEFVEREEISAAHFSAIGAFSSATLKYFDWNSKTYQDNPIDEQVEVASLIGDVALCPTGAPTLHVHTVLGRSDGTALAGHLGKGVVRPTLEIVLTESPAHLRKKFDPETGLALIDAET
jgi:predicted DNA-binding protein with PD1-like motif